MHEGEGPDLPMGKLDSICHQFELAWQRGEEPRIEAALEGLSPAECEQLLPQLLLIDLEYLQQSQVVPDVEQYLERFPQDATLVRLVLRAFEGDLSAADDEQQITERIGSEVGRYKLLEQIGEGGMGVVYMAEQQRPVRRKVALKIIKPGMDTKQVIARFEAERQALAMMDHANIARVFDAGCTESGRPYFVMELVRGIPITEYCDQFKLPTSERLKLFASVCRAVQHAHSKGIIHRDLKPTNVLVTLHDGVPVPKVIDFGVAKATGQRLTERTLFTAFAQMVGTPLYMSPEQAALSGLDVDTRSDVYSLGVLLYELLTGATPFDRQRFQTAAYDEVRRIIIEEEPMRPSTRVSTMGNAGVTVSLQRATDPAKLKRLLFGELDWIVMKTLEKDRNRRYETVSALAADINRYLNDEPVEACPPSTGYRLRKFVERHKSEVAIGVGFLAVVLLSTAVSWMLYVHARGARKDAEALGRYLEVERNRALEEKDRAEWEKSRADQQTDELQRHLYDFHIMNAGRALASDDLQQAFALLDECQLERRRWEWHRLNYLLRYDLATQYALPRQETMGAIPSPDGSQLAVFGDDGIVRLMSTMSGDVLFVDAGEYPLVRSIAFSPDGKLLFVVRWNRQPLALTHFEQQYQSELRVMRVSTGETVWSVHHPDGLMGGVTLSPAGKLLSLWRASGAPHQPTVELRDAGTGAEIWSVPQERVAYSMQFSPDGQRLYLMLISDHILFSPSTLACWNVEEHEPIWKADRADSSYFALSVDGQYLVTGGPEHTVHIWDAASGQPLDTVRNEFPIRPREALGEHNHVGIVAFSHDGSRFLSRCGLGITVWDWETKQPLRTIVQPRSWDTLHVNFSADDEHVIHTDSRFGSSVVLRDVNPPPTELLMSGHEGPVRAIQFLAGGQQLVSVGRDGTARVWDAATGKELWTEVVSSDDEIAVAIAPLGDLLATAGSEGVKLWQISTRQLVQRWSDMGSAKCVAFNQDGSQLAAGGDCLAVWNTADQRQLTRVELPNVITGVKFVRDGACLAMIDDGGAIDLFDIDSQARKRIRVTTQTALESVYDEALGQFDESLACDSTGTRIAAGILERVELWDIDEGRQATFRNDDSIRCLAFSDDGTRVFSGDAAGFLSIWNVESGDRLLYQPTGHNSVSAILLSPDGRTLATAGSDGTIRLWETRRPAESVIAQRRIVEAATRIVNSKYAGARSVADVVASLKSDTSIEPQVLPVALEIANGRGNRPRSLRSSQ